MPGIELAVVLSNKKDAYALERARLQEYKAFFVDPAGKTKEEYDHELANILHDHKVDLVVLIGYMRILTAGFVKRFPRKIINVHPALSPSYGGTGFYGSNVHKAVIAAKEKETGCTIHFVEEDVDKGKIILRKKVSISPKDTPETLKEKVQELEKKWYPEVIRAFAGGEIDI